MTLENIIDKQSVLANVKAQNKKQLLSELSQTLASIVAIDHRIIFETLLTREKLGSTGIGSGIAIPHGKVPTLGRVYGLFARLVTPVEFDAVDGQPVDPEPTIRVEHHLDDLGILQKPGDVRAKGGAQHAAAARKCLRVLE